MEKAVVLLSGGLDSATALATALKYGYEVYPLGARYGQRHNVEIAAADELVREYQRRGEHIHDYAQVHVAFPGAIKGSALTDNIEVPLDRPVSEMSDGIPVTYVPARNTFLLGLAASYAEQYQASAIFVGFNILDYSGYPDCRPEFVDAYNRLLQIGTKNPPTIYAPLVMLSKADIVRRAVELDVPLKHTWSCYSGGSKPCGRCDSCILRAEGFAKVGIADPAL